MMEVVLGGLVVEEMPLADWMEVLLADLFRAIHIAERSPPIPKSASCCIRTFASYVPKFLPNLEFLERYEKCENRHFTERLRLDDLA
jgi:hypothetical protein